LERARALGSNRFVSMSLMLRSRLHSLAGDLSKAQEALQQALDLSRESPRFIGPWIMGYLARLAKDSDERTRWISQGFDVLAKGAVSHNHFFFHAEAIDASLEAGDWDAVRYHADGLENFTR